MSPQPQLWTQGDGHALDEAKTAALMALLAELLRGGEPWRVLMEHGGRRLRLSVGPVPAASAAPVARAQASAELTECERDILRVIGEAGGRLTTGKVLSALQEANCLHGDSTVIHALADLCRRKGKLTNRKDGRGRGYGLPGWDQPA